MQEAVIHYERLIKRIGKMLRDLIQNQTNQTYLNEVKLSIRYSVINELLK